MSNPPAAAAVVGTPGTAASGAAVATPPSSAPRLSNRKRNTASRLLESATETTTPTSRRVNREPATTPAREEDPSSDFGKDPAELGSVPEKASLPPRSSSKSAAQVLDNASRRETISTKPKLLKLSLQTKPPRAAAGTTSSSGHHLLGSLFSRRFLIFIIVAGLATTVWNWRTPQVLPHSSSIEDQVAELGDILRKTTKMMQVQLDLVDMKIQKEIDSLRTELEERIEEQATSFGTELRNLEAKTEDVEASLKKLTEAGFPTRQDVLNLINSVVEERAAEGTGEALSLDDVRAVARRLVETELEKHAADGIGRVDYALGSGGGKVVDHSEGFYHGLGTGWRELAGNLLSGTHKHPLAYKLLEPSFGQPGHCLPLKGSNVYVEIALRTSIFPEAFTLEHVSKSVAYDISSAPKDFRVFGWLDSYKKEDSTAKSRTQVLLGEFVYKIDNRNVQVFSIPEDSRGKLVNMVRLEVSSNHGSPSHTCLYRFRVHGSDPQAVKPALA